MGNIWRIFFLAPSIYYLTLGLKLKHFRGTPGAGMDECSVGSDPSPDCGNQRIGPGPGLDLSEVKQRRKWKIKNVKVGNPNWQKDILRWFIFFQVDKVRAELGDLQGQEEKGVVVVSASQYCRYFNHKLQAVKGWCWHVYLCMDRDVFLNIDIWNWLIFN